MACFGAEWLCAATGSSGAVVVKPALDRLHSFVGGAEKAASGTVISLLWPLACIAIEEFVESSRERC